MSSCNNTSDPFGDATSGQTSYKLVTGDIIDESYSILQMGVEGESINGDMYKQALRSLNSMIATWQSQGIHLWSYSDATLFPVADKESYILEDSHCTNRYIQTTSTTAALTGTDTVDLTNVDELCEGFFIGFFKADQSFFWSTVKSVESSTVTINDLFLEDLPADTCVFYYQYKCKPVERVLGLRRRDSFLNDTPIHLTSRQEYYDLPTKSTKGPASEGYYHRDIPKGVLYLWPVPANSSALIQVEYERKLEDFVNTNDCPDFPKYWTEAITYNLAKRLAIKYRVPPIVMNEIKVMAQETLDQALNFDDEVADISISINRGVG